MITVARIKSLLCGVSHPREEFNARKEGSKHSPLTETNENTQNSWVSISNTVEKTGEQRDSLHFAIQIWDITGQGWIIQAPIHKIVVHCLMIPIFHWQMNCNLNCLVGEMNTEKREKSCRYLHPVSLGLIIAKHGWFALTWDTCRKH